MWPWQIHTQPWLSSCACPPQVARERAYSSAFRVTTAAPLAAALAPVAAAGAPAAPTKASRPPRASTADSKHATMPRSVHRRLALQRTSTLMSASSPATAAAQRLPTTAQPPPAAVGAVVDVHSAAVQPTECEGKALPPGPPAAARLRACMPARAPLCVTHRCSAACRCAGAVCRRWRVHRPTKDTPPAARVRRRQ